MAQITSQICSTRAKKYFNGKLAITLVKLISIDNEFIDSGKQVVIKRRSSNSQICLDIESLEGVKINNVFCENLSLIFTKKGTEVICLSGWGDTLTFYIDKRGVVKNCNDKSYVGAKISRRTLKVGKPLKIHFPPLYNHACIPFKVTSILDDKDYAID